MFGLYPNEPNYITFLLARDQFGITDGGVFTIGALTVDTVTPHLSYLSVSIHDLSGDVEPNHTDITNAPKLPIVTPDTWVTFMDGMQINGRTLRGDSLRYVYSS